MTCTLTDGRTDDGRTDGRTDLFNVGDTMVYSLKQKLIKSNKIIKYCKNNVSNSHKNEI